MPWADIGVGDVQTAVVLTAEVQCQSIRDACVHVKYGSTLMSEGDRGGKRACVSKLKTPNNFVLLSQNSLVTPKV